jgi:hypothetical protein
MATSTHDGLLMVSVMTLHLGNGSQRHLSRTLVFFSKLKLDGESSGGADQQKKQE